MNAEACLPHASTGNVQKSKTPLNALNMGKLAEGSLVHN